MVSEYEILEARKQGLSYGRFIALCWERENHRTIIPKRTADTRHIRRKGGYEQVRHFDEREAFALWKSGVSDGKIAARFGVSRATIQRWRDCLELPSLHLWRGLDTSGFAMVQDAISGKLQIQFPEGLSPQDFA